VAGLVPTYRPDAGTHGTSAALDYGVRVLRVARIVVLGHAQCGGVRAMVEGALEARHFVERSMTIAGSALQKAPMRAEPGDILSRRGTDVASASRWPTWRRLPG
jgi:carbonic anhydrase